MKTMGVVGIETLRIRGKARVTGTADGLPSSRSAGESSLKVLMGFCAARVSSAWLTILSLTNSFASLRDVSVVPKRELYDPGL